MSAEDDFETGHYYQAELCEYDEAFKYFKKAAEQGHIEAMVRVGIFYGSNSSSYKSYEESRKWFLKAIEKGNVQAMYEMAGYYEKGEVYPKNITEATNWYRKVIAKGGLYGEFSAERLNKLGIPLTAPASPAAKPQNTAPAGIDQRKLDELGRLLQGDAGKSPAAVDLPKRLSVEKLLVHYDFIDNGNGQLALVMYPPEGVADDENAVFVHDGVSKAYLIRNEKQVIYLPVNVDKVLGLLKKIKTVLVVEMGKNKWSDVYDAEVKVMNPLPPAGTPRQIYSNENEGPAARYMRLHKEGKIK